LSAAFATAERRVGPLSVRVSTRNAMIEEVVSALRERRGLRLAFANTHLLYCAATDPSLARQLRDFCVVNDGVGMNIISRIAAGAPFPENLNGTDLVPDILSASPPRTRVYLVGAKPEVAQAAAERVRERWPHLRVCGVRDGFGGALEAANDIAAVKPDLVLVAMGNPQQERLISNCSGRRSAVFIGVGALFDFLAGVAPRAPSSWRRLRLEWLFRLALEPRRMWRRYTLEIMYLMALAFRERLGRHP
jgi:exopolysaccharide biosynthesis WecB/TagA/CpsF family protein